jgi:hypothetical protein
MLPLGASGRGSRFTALSTTNPAAGARPGTKEGKGNSVRQQINVKENRRTIVLNAGLSDRYPFLSDGSISIPMTDTWLRCDNEITLQHPFEGSKSAAEVD